MKIIYTLIYTIIVAVLFSCHGSNKNVLYREGDSTVSENHMTDTVVIPNPKKPGKTITRKVTLADKIENVMAGSWRLELVDHDIKFKDKRARQKFEYTIEDIKNSLSVIFYKDNTYVLKSNRDNDKGNWKVSNDGKSVAINSHNTPKTINYKVLEIRTDELVVEMDKDHVHFIFTLVKK
jgi:hypothetical protein